MKKLAFFLVIGLLGMNASYALQLASDVNGPVTVSEPQLNVGDMAPRVT